MQMRAALEHGVTATSQNPDHPHHETATPDETQRRPELRKHKTMKLMAVDDSGRRIPNDQSTVNTDTKAATTSTATTTDSKQSQHQSSLLRDYAMATNLLEARRRLDRTVAHSRHTSSKSARSHRAIDLERVYNTAPTSRRAITALPSTAPPSTAVEDPMAWTETRRTPIRLVLPRTPPTAATNAHINATSETEPTTMISPQPAAAKKKKMTKSVSFCEEPTASTTNSVVSPRRRAHPDAVARSSSLSSPPRCHGDSMRASAHAMSPIHAACRKGDYLVVKHLVSFYSGHEAVQLVNAGCACGQTPLQVASECGHTKIVKLLLRRQAQPNRHHGASSIHLDACSSSTTAHGVASPHASSPKKKLRSCLALACDHAHGEVVDLLLEYGARVDEDALVATATQGDVRSARALMAAGTSAANKKRHVFAHGGSGRSHRRRHSHEGSETVSDVIANGLDRLWGTRTLSSLPSTSSSASASSSSSSSRIESSWITRAVSEAISCEHLSVLTALLGDGRSATSCDLVARVAIEATKEVDFKRLRALTKLYPHELFLNVRTPSGCTLLHLAAQHGSTKSATLLIRMGMDVNVRGACAISPLYMACARGHSAIARLLVNAGATCARMGPNDETPLHIAAQENQLSCVEMLLTEGRAAVDDTTKDDCTALHLACQRGNSRVARCLLDHGANVNARTVCGETPLLKASRMSHLDTVKLLLSRAADPTASAKSSYAMIAPNANAMHASSVTDESSLSQSDHTGNSTATINSTRSLHVDEVESEDSISHGHDSIFIAKSNTHTSFKGWLKSVLHNN